MSVTKHPKYKGDNARGHYTILTFYNSISLPAKSMNSLWSRTSVRTGLAKNSFLTTKDVMVRRSVQSAAGQKLRCPHCGNTLVPKKDKKHFIVHKCVNPKCPYYLHNLKKVDKADLKEDYGKNKYKLHYIYREFTMDFFSMDLNTLPKNASSLEFSKHNAHVMSLCLTLHVNLGLSLRKTSQDITGFKRPV